MARMAKHIARVVSRMTKEVENGTTMATAASTARTIRILVLWLMEGSLAAEQAGRLDRQNQDHRRVEREVGNLREQRLAEIIGEADGERADRGPAQTTHPANNDDGE